MPERLFTTHQVADLLGAAPREVSEWIQRGWLLSQQLPDGPVRVTERALIQFLKGRGIDIMQLMVSTAVKGAPPDGRRVEGRGGRGQARPSPTVSEDEVDRLLHKPAPQPTANGQTAAGPATDEQPATARPVEAESADDLAARVLLTGPGDDVAPSPEEIAALSAPPEELDELAAEEDELPLMGESLPVAAPPAPTAPAVAPRPAHPTLAARAAGPTRSAAAGTPTQTPTPAAQAAGDSRLAGAGTAAGTRPETPLRPQGAAGGGESQDTTEDEDGGEGEDENEEKREEAAVPAAAKQHTTRDATAEPASAVLTAPVGTGAGDGAPLDAAAQIADAILADAVARGASHVHLEPRAGGLGLWLRVDGTLHEKPNFHRRLPAGLGERLTRHLLLRAGLAGDPPARPETGRLACQVDGRRVEFALSAMPAAHGVRLVLAADDGPVPTADLEQLGLDELTAARLEAALLSAGNGGGLVLVVGGRPAATKATLRALAGTLAARGQMVLLAEAAHDGAPVDLPGACAVPVAPLDGYGFSQAARAMVSQAAEGAVIAELRDPATAAAAVEAALGGAVVLAGVRAPDAPGALKLLAEMAVEPWPLASVLKAVVASRTVRRLCRTCRRAAPKASDRPDPSVTQLAFLPAAVLNGKLYEPVGCPRCGGSGYAGTVALTSVMLPDRAVTDLIRRRAGGSPLAVACRQAGARPFADLAAQRLTEGATDLEEIARVL